MRNNTPNINVEHSLLIVCACGKELSAEEDYFNKGRIVVEPCENCLDEKYEEGKKDGKEEVA
jgi:hypothetical protein